MREIFNTTQDLKLLAQLLQVKRELNAPPVAYDNLVVIKPWGYEFQLHSNQDCSTWLACLKPGQAVSMHCHQFKSVFFIPLSAGLCFKTLTVSQKFDDYIKIDRCVFHSQENDSDHDAFFLECEWPANKSDLIRYKDKYGRENKGYEGAASMLPYDLAVDQLKIPLMYQMMRG